MQKFFDQNFDRLKNASPRTTKPDDRSNTVSSADQAASNRLSNGFSDCNKSLAETIRNLGLEDQVITNKRPTLERTNTEKGKTKSIFLSKCLILY